MTWTAEIYDASTSATYDITSRLLSVSASERLGAESNTFSVSAKWIELFHKFHTIVIRKNGVKRFAGVILNQTDSDKGFKQTDFECMDWTYVLNNRVIAKVYNSDDIYLGRPDLIVKDMIAEKAPELTTANVRPVNYSIEALQFPYEKVFSAVGKVMDFLPTHYWYVDSDKDVHLFNQYESEGVSFAKSNGSYNFLRNTLAVRFQGDMQANRIWIIGAKKASGTYLEVFFTANGTQRYFGPLPYEPNYTEIYLNGLRMDSKLEQNDDQQQDFLINKAQRVIFIPDNIGTPYNGTIKVRFRPTVQVIDYFENAASIAQIGLYEKVIKNKDITDKLSARQYGKAEIKRKSTDKRLISLSTYEDVKIGQRCPVNIVESSETHGNWNVVGDFVVVSVETSVTVTESHTHELRRIEMEEIT